MEMNRIKTALSQSEKLLSIYFTAGFPNLEDTVPILKSLQANGVDMVEIGLPFSDPLADGPTIQESSTIALKNGMTTEKLFEQLDGIRGHINIPLIIMGYFNPIMQYGVEAFCKRCQEIGIDGFIIPDLPLEEYQEKYQHMFDSHGFSMIFLITPQTSEDRIRKIDAASTGFIYMVSSASTTGAKEGFGEENMKYFERIDGMQLKSPRIVGFGISNEQTFQQATKYSSGAILGSAFIRALSREGIDGISPFLASIR